MRESINDITNDFERLYLGLRETEGRIYNDEQVRSLPELKPSHKYFKEWQVRKDSAKKLLNYLEKKNSSLNILEIGCGNGWLANKLATIPKSHVIGMDVNYVEVEQAARVFNDKANLHFVYGDLNAGLFKEAQFDVIVFAASIQYFAQLETTVDQSLRLLKPHGEIHILDSHFYRLSELAMARQRSLSYYMNAGFPAMAEKYFHHSLLQLEPFHFSVLYNPNGLFNRFVRNINPFYWIRIRN